MAACQHPVVGQVDVFPPLNKRFVFSHSSVACKRQNNWASGSPPIIRRETIWSILVARVSPSSFVDGLGCPALEFWNVASSANSRRQSSKGKAVRVGSKELCSNERIFCVVTNRCKLKQSRGVIALDRYVSGGLKTTQARNFSKGCSGVTRWRVGLVLRQQRIAKTAFALRCNGLFIC